MTSNEFPESKEISDLFKGSSLRERSSLKLGWNGITVERRSTEAGERPEAASDHYFIVLWETHSTHGEREDVRGQFASYIKHPGTISTCIPGIIPRVRAFSKTEAIVCALNPVFLAGIEDELDCRPTDPMRSQLGITDKGLWGLVSLLATEAAEEGRCGRLYADSLAHTLGIRFLYTTREQRQQEPQKMSTLPRYLLQRIVELMHTNLASDLSLATLASESGYSRAHFVRMFRAATGQTPYQYLLDLRLERARQFIKNGSRSLTDIAASCGFASHTSFSKAFRRRFRTTPSLYRREI
ncbi:helix-turn-helix domain-containing protein [Terriglobus saanensis]|uniref:Transcriptional regulator, AraC family n=1 Tax=Terriglobus saanensis (strain ATCC BAA-1853 / DSM 23119 / SP1PR4) TaxID=401053 RepID=E8UYE1_TERSS|nr:helix-turn-helix domain-containing protein [Terriglobus saanensis]ADV82029.1 transcriptional regulator, AraC family [Terriglobus saanensis SP1PR4]